MKLNFTLGSALVAVKTTLHILQKNKLLFLYQIIVRNGFLPASSKKKKKKHSFLDSKSLNHHAKKIFIRGRRERKRRASGRSAKCAAGPNLKSKTEQGEKALEAQNFLPSLPPLLGYMPRALAVTTYLLIMYKRCSCSTYSNS